jgi:hypothetical protein
MFIFEKFRRVGCGAVWIFLTDFSEELIASIFRVQEIP